MSRLLYLRSRWARDGATESSDWFRKWYGVVADASKYRPSMDPMHSSVQYGSSISAIGVPNWSSWLSYSHMARPHPCFELVPSEAIVDTSARYSGYAALRS